MVRSPRFAQRQRSGELPRPGWTLLLHLRMNGRTRSRTCTTYQDNGGESADPRVARRLEDRAYRHRNLIAADQLGEATNRRQAYGERLGLGQRLYAEQVGPLNVPHSCKTVEGLRTLAGERGGIIDDL